MEFARRAAAADRVKGDHRLHDPSPHGDANCYPPSFPRSTLAQVTADAPRRELLKERIREEIIAAERRDLELEVRRELRSGHAIPHPGTSPVRQGDRLHLHMFLSPGLCSEEAVIATPGGVSISRRSVKDRMGEWYRPPWHDRSTGEEDPLTVCARLPNKTFSGLKRKRTPETSSADNQKSFGKWSCALCHVNLYSEFIQ
uniref:Uncharacterized protein n=1 Tax=Arundo donax TaxID=35708 RepID=A0A0A9GLD0_ARUDO